MHLCDRIGMVKITLVRKHKKLWNAMIAHSQKCIKEIYLLTLCIQAKRNSDETMPNSNPTPCMRCLRGIYASAYRLGFAPHKNSLCAAFCLEGRLGKYRILLTVLCDSECKVCYGIMRCLIYIKVVYLRSNIILFLPLILCGIYKK